MLALFVLNKDYYINFYLGFGHCYYLIVLCVTDKDTPLPTVLRVETEQEREVSEQLKQANDTVARLQDELSDFRQRSAPLWEKETKVRDSKINLFLSLLDFGFVGNVCNLKKNI